MLQDYRRDAVRQYVLDNIDTLLDNGTLYSCIVERMSADYDGDKFVDKNGYDQINENTEVRKEVKNTNSIQNESNFRISSFEGKRGEFDIIKIIDSLNNRVFEIPHDVFFAEKEDGGEFRWSATYGQNDKSKRGVRPQNTELLLRHEVI